MSTTNGQPLDPLELVSLPETDPRRQQHAATLSGEARAQWESEAAFTDQLRAALPEIPVPAGLEARLLAIPGTSADASAPAVLRPRTGFRGQPVANRIAAGLIILAGLAGMIAIYIMVFRQPPTPVRLDAGLADSLSAVAVQHHQTPVEIASSDPTTVKSAIAAHPLDFPVIMLQPSAGTLEGGGVCDFGTTKAAFTRWKVESQTYTLYQFNGKDLTVPPLFYATTNVATKLWSGDLHYRVFLFPGTGGKCCWALVMESENAPNVFSQYGAAY